MAGPVPESLVRLDLEHAVEHEAGEQAGRTSGARPGHWRRANRAAPPGPTTLSGSGEPGPATSTPATEAGSRAAESDRRYSSGTDSQACSV